MIETNLYQLNSGEDNIDTERRESGSLFSETRNDWREACHSKPSVEEPSREPAHGQHPEGEQPNAEIQTPNPTFPQGIQSLGRGGYNQPLHLNETFIIDPGVSTRQHPLPSDSIYSQIPDSSHELWKLPPEVREMNQEDEYWCAKHQKILRPHAISQARDIVEEDHHCWETRWHSEQGNMIDTNTPLLSSEASCQGHEGQVTEETTMTSPSDMDEVQIVWAVPRASNGHEGQPWICESKTW